MGDPGRTLIPKLASGFGKGGRLHENNWGAAEVAGTAAEMMRCDQNVWDYGFSPLDLLN